MVSSKDLLGRTAFMVRDASNNYEFYTLIRPMDDEELVGKKKITPAFLKKLELWGQAEFMVKEIKAGMRMPK